VDKLSARTEAIVSQWRDAIAASAGVLLRHAIVEVAADSAGWIESGVAVKSGESVTLLSVGSAALANNAQVSFGAQSMLWRRIRPGGHVGKFPAATTTFTAGESGDLDLVVNFPGAWVDPAGELDGAWPRQAAVGGFTVAVLVWKGAAIDGLSALATTDQSGVAGIERARMLSPAQLPRGWHSLWRVGDTEIYADSGTATGRQQISCRCACDAGILKYPIDMPLEATTRLAWHWRMIALPSVQREDALTSHDYLSIAVEFENGQDLTYIWSSSLPVGTAFRCPLPWWDKHETHQVVRSGNGDLGRWLEEERPILADYKAAIEGPVPQRIVGVWLIAVAVLQRRRGECDYRNIELRSGDRVRQVEP
jgi:Protein of unknown function (DUF3047)